jgi:hypothetical protein
MMTMKKTSLLMIPLGAALLFLSSNAPSPPGVERRPVLLLEPLVQPEARQPETGKVELQVGELVDSVDYLPAKYGVLEAVLEQGTVGERKSAIRELRHLGTDSAVQLLSIALGDEDKRVQKAAFEALSRIGGDEALAAIASVAADYDPVMRMRAVDALGDAGGFSAGDYLELALHDEDSKVRETAVLALGDLNDSQSVNIISLALRDPDIEVRQRAVEMLDELNDDALFRTLYPAL